MFMPGIIRKFVMRKCSMTFSGRENCFEKKHLILGEGSNILFSGDYDGTVVRMMLKGIEATGKKMDMFHTG